MLNIYLSWLLIWLSLLDWGYDLSSGDLMVNNEDCMISS